MDYLGLVWRFARAGLYGTLGAVSAYAGGLQPTQGAILAIAILGAIEHWIKTDFMNNPLPDKTGVGPSVDSAEAEFKAELLKLLKAWTASTVASLPQPPNTMPTASNQASS